METAIESRTTPIHLWIVGILSLLWSAFGCFDYVKTRMRDTDYLASMMPTVDPNVMLAWIDGFPLWAQVGWGLGVWMGLIGSVLLLVRNRNAVPFFGLSRLGAILGLGYQAVAAPPLAGAEGPMGNLMPWIIIAVCLALFLYARAQRASGVLR